MLAPCGSVSAVCSGDPAVGSSVQPGHGWAVLAADRGRRNGASIVSGRRVRTQRAVRLGGIELSLDSPILVEAEAAEQAAYRKRRLELAPLPPSPERSQTREGPWQTTIMTVARSLDWYVYHPHLSRWSERGWPDLSLLGSRALWFELKDDHAHLTDKQVGVIDRMIACGLEVHVLRPWHGLQLVADILTGQAASGPSRCTKEVRS